MLARVRQEREESGLRTTMGTRSTTTGTIAEGPGTLTSFGLSRSPLRGAGTGSIDEGHSNSNSAIGISGGAGAGAGAGAVIFSSEVEIITRATNYCNLPPRGTLVVTTARIRFICNGDGGDGAPPRIVGTPAQQQAGIYTYITVKIKARVYGTPMPLWGLHSAITSSHS